jgi:hypothetical protein
VDDKHFRDLRVMDKFAVVLDRRALAEKQVLLTIWGGLDRYDPERFRATSIWDQRSGQVIILL